MDGITNPFLMEAVMPKKAKELSAVEVKRIEKPGRHAVGVISGLLLVVKETGAKVWILRTVAGNKRRNIGLGGYPEVSLAEARDKAREIKRQIQLGIDPVAERQARRRALIQEQSKKMTFSEATRLCYEKKKLEYKKEKYAKAWISSVNRYAIPIIGDMAVDEIELPHILKVLEPIWQTKTETANRLRQRLEHVLNWSTVSGYRTGENPARWKGHLDAVLPEPSKVHQETHLPALPRAEVGGFLRDLRMREGMAARALEFLVFTVARSEEIRLATWDEVDLKKRTWTVPKERAKMEREHVVPLSEDAERILCALPRLEGSPYIFPAPRGGSLSDMTLPKKIKDMHKAAVKNGGNGYIDPKQGRVAVPHGFRSTFRDWGAEKTDFPPEVLEMALGHAIGNKVEAAYRRGDLFEKRRKLMEAWATFCNQVSTESTSNVKSIRRVKG
ncbi:MAG: integrase arm-type DNA-binding domain-containing protein [Desulfatiglandaceae bacterium]